MTKSDACAIHDGIKRTYDERHNKVYHIPCGKCGRIIERKQYTSEKIYLCGYCKLAIDEKKKQAELDQLPAGKSRKELLFDKAVAEIAKQVIDMSEYQKPIQAALTRVERYGSIPEMMVAIELLRLRYKIIPQQKIGNYHADFVIPSIKLVLEVDGEKYHDGPDQLRDACMKAMLGDGWCVLHISAELIRRHIRTLGAVIRNIKLHHQ